MSVWVGRFVDDRGEFEIITSASSREYATEMMYRALKEIIRDEISIPKNKNIKGEVRQIYIAEVGLYDFIRYD